MQTVSSTSSFKRIGRFQLLEEVGRGAAGVVFRARDVGLQRVVALKLLRPTANATESTLVNEGRLLAGMQHPRVVSIHEIGEHRGAMFVVMEWMEGGSLQAAIANHGALGVREACQLLADAAEGLAFAHARGVVHRDVKPGNLLIGGDGRCKIADFGIGFRHATEIVEPQRCVGTAAYLAPEVIDRRGASAASDVYSLACAIYCALAGEPPYASNTTAGLLECHRTAPVPDLSVSRPDVPRTLARLVMSGMSKRPEERPDAASFEAALRTTFLPRVSNEPSSPPPRAPARPDRTPMLAMITVLIVAAIGVLVVVLKQHEANLESAKLMIEAQSHTEPDWSQPIKPPALHDAVSSEVEVESQPATEPEMIVARPPEPAKLPVDPPPTPSKTVTASPRVFDLPDDALTRPAAPLKQESDFTIEDAPKLQMYASASDQVQRRFVGRAHRVFSNSAKTAVFVFFQPPDEEIRFRCVWFPRSFEAMEAAFGGSEGTGLEGKRIAVTGRIESYQGRPQIIVESPSQIEVLPDY